MPMIRNMADIEPVDIEALDEGEDVASLLLDCVGKFPPVFGDVDEREYESLVLALKTQHRKEPSQRLKWKAVRNTETGITRLTVLLPCPAMDGFLTPYFARTSYRISGLMP